MQTLQKLLLENKAWAKWHAEINPEYFQEMAKDQNPEILWIGCADSRVPPDEIINTKPGNLFVHRNIANVVSESDESIMSVIEYAVKYLKVKYIIVCGHLNCGGVKAAFDGIDNPRLANWTRGISELKLTFKPKDFNELVKINVSSQVEKLKKMPIIKEARANSNYPQVLGWVYDISNGLINELSQFED